MLKAGIDLPMPWRDIPDVAPKDLWFLEAFGELSTCRAIGMDLGALPWTAIVQYVDRQKIEAEADFILMMRMLDSAFLKFVSDQRNSK